MIDIAHPAIATALLAARAALACDAEPELEERALRLIASASVPSTPASPAHRLLLSRATETITTWQAGREADRQVAPDIDRALTLLGFAAQFEDYERKTWLPARTTRWPAGCTRTWRRTKLPAGASSASRPRSRPRHGLGERSRRVT